MAAAKKVADLLKEDAENDAIAKSEFLSILANKHRLHILFLLSKSEYSLSELTRELNETTVALSRHLMILRENKIITGRRFGKMVRYSLTSERVARMIATVNDIYSGTDPSHSAEPASSGEGRDAASADVKALEALFRNLYPPTSEVD
jgi:DNA-binding transcriptional ArsR family regulator